MVQVDRVAHPPGGGDPDVLREPARQFSAKNADILQPAQKVFITWDPAAKVETFTVQPKFEGNALDFGMVIPTPSQPKLDTMPRDFFKALDVMTTPKRRAFAESKLMPRIMPQMMDQRVRAAPSGASRPTWSARLGCWWPLAHRSWSVEAGW